MGNGRKKAEIKSLPHKASRYDMVSFKPQTGDFDALKVTGQFPYARYFGFNLYDYNEATDFTGKADYEIVPDEGSGNPYDRVVPPQDENDIQSGRSVVPRSYTVWLVKQGTEIPSYIANRENVIFYPETFNGVEIEKLAFMTRVYRPDEGMDLLGGVPLPTVSAVKFGDNQTVTPPEIGMDLRDLQDKFDMLFFNEEINTTWDVQKMFAGDDIVFHRVSDAGLFPNAHNEYIISPLEVDYVNKVAVVTLKKAPTAENTYTGGEFAGGTDVRYWSFCTGGLGETGTPECLCDDQVTKNADGSLTIVIAPFLLESIIKKAGLNYMKWGVVYKPILIHHHMMGKDAFDGKIGNVESIDRPPAVEERTKTYMDAHKAENWMGDYTPKGHIFSVLEFKTRLAAGQFRTAFE